MEDARAEYVETLAKMADLSGDPGLGCPGPRDWNRLVDRLQVARRELAQTEEGRAFIAEMMTDSRLTVRLWAASHALHWGEVGARRVLETIAGDSGAGLNRLSAEMTLKEFDAGRLNPDW